MACKHTGTVYTHEVTKKIIRRVNNYHIFPMKMIVLPRFDANKNMESLELVWVSQANALQRKGRAGRVMPGVCIHLFTRHRYEYHFLRHPVPELHRVSLEQLILRIKTLPHFADMTPHEVLGKFVIASFIIARSGIEGMWPSFCVFTCVLNFVTYFCMSVATRVVLQGYISIYL